MKLTKNDIRQKRAELEDRRQASRGGRVMKLKIDWRALLRAVIKAAWPFIAGAVGGFVSGCTVGGVGPNFFG